MSRFISFDGWEIPVDNTVGTGEILGVAVVLYTIGDGIGSWIIFGSLKRDTKRAINGKAIASIITTKNFLWNFLKNMLLSYTINIYL